MVLLLEYESRRMIRIGGTRNKIVVSIIVILILIIVVAAGFVGVQNLFLDWKMLDVMYLNKTGVSWWSTFSLNGLLFFVAIPMALIVALAGLPYESKFLNLVWMSERIGRRRYPSPVLVAGWKILLFVGSYLLLTFIFIENVRYLALLFQSSASGVGSWGQIQQALFLIFNPMVPVEVVVDLVATIEVQYTIFLIFMSLLFIVIGIRVVLDLIHYFARIGPLTERPEVRILASISFLVVLGLLWFLLTVPTSTRM